MTYRLPDGTWATSPIFVGDARAMTCQCADGCDWESLGVPHPVSPGCEVQMQRCRRCGWQRGKYLGVPPGAETGAESPLPEESTRCPDSGP
jgi:hypothetical protein